MNTRPMLALAGLVSAVALALSGCSSSGAQPETERPAAEAPQTEEAPAFPRTVSVPAGPATEAVELVVEAEPQRIAALDYESAEVVAELGLADRLVLVPEAVQNPALGGHVDELSDVEQTIPVAMELNAETVIALEPDLVLMSPRHGAETKIGAVLEQSGVQTLVLPQVWADSASLVSNIALIGEATGAEDRAAELEAELEAGLTPQQTEGEPKRVLVLTNQAGRPFATAGAAFPLEMLELAGATSVSDELGMTVTGPITAEQVLEADPAGILLIDMNGSGDRIFADLLGNPAVAALPAVAEGRTMLVEGPSVQALGLTRTVDGLAELNEWVQTLP